jgi:hypothetical protein
LRLRPSFATFPFRRVTLDEVPRITADSVVALAGFVDRVIPDVLQQILSMLT